MADQLIGRARVEIVADLSRFAPSLMRGVAAGMRAAENVIVSSLLHLDEAFDQAGRSFAHQIQQGAAAAARAVEAATDAMRVDLRQVDNAAARTGAALRSTGSSTGVLHSALGALGTQAKMASLAIGATLVGITAYGLKAAASLEQTTVGFTALLGSEAAAKEEIKELQDFAARTPFAFQGLSDAARRMLAFGTTVGITKDNLLPTLTIIGDMNSVLGGSQANIDHVILAFGQIASKGHVMSQELNQISDALPGFNVRQAIAAKLGVSEAEALKMVEAGAVGSKVGIDALLEGMAKFPGAAGAMALQAQTLTGVFSTFKDTVSIALSSAFTPVIPAIKDSLRQITPILGETFDKLAPALGSALTGILPLITGVIQGLTPILVPILNTIGSALENLTPTLAPLGTAIGTAVTSLYPVLNIVGDIIGALATGLTPVIAALAPVLAGMATGLFKAIEPLLPVVVNLGTALASAILPVAQALAPVFVQLGAGLGELLGKLGAGLLPIIAQLGPIFAQMAPVIADFASKILAALLPALDSLIPAVLQLLNALMPLIPAILPLIPPLLDITLAFLPLLPLIAELTVLLAAIITPLLNLTIKLIDLGVAKAIVPLIQELANAMDLLKGPIEAVAHAFEIAAAWINNIDWGKTGKAILHGLNVAVQAVGQFFVNMWNTITSSVSSGIASVESFFSDLWDTITSGVTSGINTVVTFFTELPGKIIAALQALPGQLAAFGTQAFDAFFFSIGFVIGVGLRGIVFIFQELPVMIVNIFIDLWNSVFQATSSGTESLISYVSQIPGRAMAAIDSLIGSVTSWATNTWNSASNATSSGISSVISFFSGLPGRAISAIQSLSGSIYGWGVSVGASASRAISSGIDSVIEFFRGLPGRAVEAVSQLGSMLVSNISGAIGMLYQVGVQLIQGMINGIVSMIASAIDTGKRAVQDIISGIKSGLGIGSPSRVLAKIGVQTMQGYIVGIEEHTRPTRNAAAEALNPYNNRGLMTATTPSTLLEAKPPTLSGVGESAGTPPIYLNVFIGNRDITDIVRVETSSVMSGQAREISNVPRSEVGF